MCINVSVRLWVYWTIAEGNQERTEEDQIDNIRESSNHSNQCKRPKPKREYCFDLIKDFSAECVSKEEAEIINCEYPVFVHIDVDEVGDHPDVQAVSGVPHFKFYKAGKCVKEFSGANAATLEKTITENI